jgi:hypothetical protein
MEIIVPLSRTYRMRQILTANKKAHLRGPDLRKVFV